jgi:hypothetical protein
MSDEFEHAIVALVDALPFLSMHDRRELLECIHEEDAKHSAAFVDISTDDEEQSVRLEIAKGVIAKWLEEHGR